MKLKEFKESLKAFNDDLEIAVPFTLSHSEETETYTEADDYTFDVEVQQVATNEGTIEEVLTFEINEKPFESGTYSYTGDELSFKEFKKKRLDNIINSDSASDYSGMGLNTLIPFTDSELEERKEERRLLVENNFSKEFLELLEDKDISKDVSEDYLNRLYEAFNKGELEDNLLSPELNTLEFLAVLKANRLAKDFKK